jgi:cytochrome o ubiquinol oxidase subunit 2
LLPGAAALLCLDGCGMQPFRVLYPAGPLADAEWRFTIIDIAITSLIVLPSTLMIALFIWRYRASRHATYDPHWTNSVPLEIGMWFVPLVAVCVLGYFSYQGVYATNPYGPTALGEKPAGVQQASTGATHPLQVDVISTDWLWIFVYPKQKIATVDELVVPTGRNVALNLTSATVVNDFYIPQVAPMIDVMPGMRTEDALRIDRPGDYTGFSAMYSGPGFAWMQFHTRALSTGQFDAWVTQVQRSPLHLSYPDFEKLAQPTINLFEKSAEFSQADPNLLRQVYDAARAGKAYPVPFDLTRHMKETYKNFLLSKRLNSMETQHAG